MAPPTSNQRLDALENQMANLQNTIAEKISNSVGLAMEAAKLTIAEQISQRMEETMRKSKEDLEVANYRLEGRIDRTRENLEGMLTVARGDQNKFQSEMRATLEKFRSVPFNGGDHQGSRGTGNRVVDLENRGEELEGANLRGENEVFDGGGSGGAGGGAWNRGGGNWRHRKLDMPAFDGSDPDGWILRGERFFAFYGFSDSEKMEAAVVAMEGDALKWYQWENKRRPVRSWESMKNFVLAQFRPLNAGSLYEQWLATTQTTTVWDYRRKFIELAPLEGITEEVLMGKFIHRLQAELQTEIRVLNPYNLDQAMELALKLEEKNRVNGPKKMGPRSGSFSIYNRSPGTNSSFYGSQGGSNINTKQWASNSSVSQASVNNVKPVATSTRGFGEMRRLTEKELQEKRAKGLCFKCDEKWGMGHKCQRRELSVLFMEDLEEEDMEGTLSGSEAPPSPTEEIPPEVSLNSVIGLTNPKTMKLLGRIGGREVVVMIDPSATHNFLSFTTIEKLAIPVTESAEFGVSLGDGRAVRGVGVCKGVELHLDGGLVVEEDFLPLGLGNSDVILGVQWLETLGTIVSNWKTQEMRFVVDGESYTLKGDPSLARSKVSLKAMLRTLLKEGGGLWLEFNQVEV